MCPILNEEDASKKDKERELTEYSKDYSTVEFNNRLEAIRKENKWTYKRTASEFGISARYLLYLRRGTYKSPRINQKAIDIFEDTFLFWHCVGLIHKWSPKASLEWIEIETHTYRGEESAEHRKFLMEEMYQPINSSDLIDVLVSNNPLKIAGRLRYWLNHHDVLNHRETRLFINQLEEELKTQRLPIHR
jgi:transcriptional regulator with XRE-family HTH domain